MSADKHTPGPWFMSPSGCVCCQHQPSGKHTVATVFDACDGPILAAAPDLLAACKACDPFMEQLGEDGGIGMFDRDEAERAFKMLRSAIAKAEGR
jgi:hypothetical protein